MYSCDTFSSRMPVCTTTLLKEESGIPVVSVHGEMDIHTTHDFSVVMLKAVFEAGKGGTVIADLSGAEFMSCSGLTELMRLRDLIEDSSGSLAVVYGWPLEHLLGALGLEDEFDLYPDLRSAVAGYPVAG